MEEVVWKVHGSGNTFYMLEATQDDTAYFVEMAKWLCNPSNEGGADGLLVILPSEQATARMRVINADGSEASMCGNGLRCVTRHVLEKNQLTEATVETMKGTLVVEQTTSLFETIPTFAVDIAPVSFALSSLPMVYGDKDAIRHEVIPAFAPTIPYTAVSVPNPHLIGIVPKAYIQQTYHQQALASYLNSPNAYTPDGVNVSYVLPLDAQTIFVRTFERGVGFTNACGTAMTASALVSVLEGYVQTEEVTVYNPGGVVRCQVQKSGDTVQLRLIGNATVTHEARLQQDGTTFKWTHWQQTEEQQQYERLIATINTELEHLMA